METEERWIKHYSSLHRILLVGEGDFSFARSLAAAFGSASNIVATSLDSKDELITKYKNAMPNVSFLEEMGASVLHGIDTTKMKHYSELGTRKFDRIIYNFPHAGFHGKEDKPHIIRKHRNLVCEFFRNASGMLQENGEIHVSHKTTYPFNNWKIEDLASNYSLKLIECSDFQILDYPGYNNKKGSGSNCDKAFPLGECSTFKFILCAAEAKKMSRVAGRQLDFPMQQMEQHPASFNRQLQPFTVTFANALPLQSNRGLPPCPLTVRDVPPLHNGLTLHFYIRNECYRIFGGYLYHVEEMFGRTDYDFRGSLIDALKLGFVKYMQEIPGRPVSGYVDILEELRHLSIMRSRRLREMLSVLGTQL